MSVVRPQSISGLELVQASADELGADALANGSLLHAPAFPLLAAVPFVSVEIEDLHSESLKAGDADRTPACATVQQCPPERWTRARPARLPNCAGDFEVLG